jgi:hypothetical protein
VAESRGLLLGQQLNEKRGNRSKLYIVQFRAIEGGIDKVKGIVNGFKAKDLCGIPWRVAFALQFDGAASPETMRVINKIRSSLLSDYDTWDEVPKNTRAVIEDLDKEWLKASKGGWYLRSAMPWIKRNCMPESTTDRPTSAIEYVFLMTKSAKYFYDADAIRCPSSDSYQNDLRPAGVLRQRVNKKSKYPDAGQFKKQDQTGNPTYTGFNGRYKNWKQSDCSPEVSGGSKNLKGHSGNLKADGTPFVDDATRNYRNSDPFFESWQGLYQEGGEPLALIVNPQARPEIHFATFPDLLAETFIKAGTSEYGCCPKCGAPYQRIVEASGGTIGESWHPHADDEITGQIGGMPTKGYKREFKGWKPGCTCNAGDPVPCLVLDPFMGSGTVAVVARDLNRSSVGCELNPEYIKIIKQRLQAGSCLDTGVVSYHFEKVPQ